MMVPSGNNAALTLAKYVDQLYAEGKLNGTSTSGTGESSSSADSASSDASGSSSSEGTTDDPEAATASQSTLDTTTVAPAYGEEGFDGSDYTGRSYFVQLMNQKAQELGCTNTHFTNPTACTTRTTTPPPGT